MLDKVSNRGWEVGLSMASHSQAPVWGTSGHPHWSTNNPVCVCVCIRSQTDQDSYSHLLSKCLTSQPLGLQDLQYSLLGFKDRTPISQTATKYGDSMAKGRVESAASVSDLQQSAQNIKEKTGESSKTV